MCLMGSSIFLYSSCFFFPFYVGLFGMLLLVLIWIWGCLFLFWVYSMTLCLYVFLVGAGCFRRKIYSGFAFHFSLSFFFLSEGDCGICGVWFQHFRRFAWIEFFYLFFCFCNTLFVF